MNALTMAWRMLRRDARSGELLILMCALIIAVTSTTAISLFADRLHNTMRQQSADFMAADLVITSPFHIADDWLTKAGQLNLQQAKTAEFSSVLMENEELLLAGIKAVSQHYPLRGYLKTTDNDYLQETVRHSGPTPGKVWVEKRILSALHLKLGDTLRVGELPLVIEHILTYEPDKRGDVYSLSPRVMINGDDLLATEIIQPGSHVHYFFQFSGLQDDLIAFNHWVKDYLAPSQRIMDIYEDRPELGSALQRAERYLGLCSIIVIIIAGVAIAMATRRYSERHFDTTAILRCLGLKQQQVLSLYIIQFMLLGLVANSIALSLGWLAQEVLFYWLRDLLPSRVSSPGIFAVLFGFVTGLAILFGFALPPLLRLKQVAPLRVLRRDLDPLPNAAWLVYGLAMLLIGLFIWRYTDDLKMSVVLIGSGLVTTTLLGIVIYLGLKQSRILLPRVGLHGRFALQNLIRNATATTTQILAFSITLVAMILTLTVRTDLLEDWQQQLPDDAPNHFALNIFPEQKQAMQQQLQQHAITNTRFYPIARGRLIRINDIAVQQIVSKESQGERATHRDLSLTWGDTLPEDNKVVKGEWGDKLSPGNVSIEAKLAKSLKVDVGDKLTFTIGTRQLSATINSVRKVKWDTMKPNFYMYFTPGTLEKFPTTYLTSFYLPAEKKSFLNTLVKQFPGTTILEVDLILAQFKSILTQLTQAINYLLYFALLAGFTVLFAAIYSTLDQRIYEGALMRTLGANKTLLQRAHQLEFFILGLTSSLFALLLSETIIFVLYHFVLHLDYQADFQLWGLTIIIGTVFITVAGLWGVRNVIKQSPMQIFRQV